MTFEHLKKWNIYGSDALLKLKPGSMSRAAETDSVGQDKHWSADGLYRHLCMLEDLVPRTNEAAERLWINAFFFRVASMSPDGSKIVLNLEGDVPPAASENPTDNDFMCGFVNFTATSTTEAYAQFLLRYPQLKRPQDHTLFVAEAKGPDQRLASHTPQAIYEMYAYAKHIGKMIIRGALTNGLAWIFFVLKLNRDGNGGKYYVSGTIDIQVMDDNLGVPHISRRGSSLIVAIMAHWIQRSHKEIGIEDYFELP